MGRGLRAHDPDSVMQALQAGANEYLMKPFNLDIIREKLEPLGITAA
jgi:response regulator of citrate/malate metabolism